MRAIRLVIGMVVLGGTGQLSAQQVFRARADSALDRTAASLKTHGFERSGDLLLGVLGERERDTVVVGLEREWQYVALAICDEDCGDLDLHLLDPTGREVAFDVKAGPTPQVQISPTLAGNYTLVVAMDKCAVQPCYYGVRWVRKRSQS